MGQKWDESRNPTVTNWDAYRVEIVGAMRYTEGTESERESQS